MKVLQYYPFSTLTCIAICVLSLAPIAELRVTQDVQLSDKWAHFIMYAAFTLVIWAERLKQRQTIAKIPLTTILIYTFLLPVFISAMLELLQAYATTYRSGEWLDLAANTIGAALGNVGGIVAFKCMGNTL